MNTVAELVERARSAREDGDLLVARGYWRRATQMAPDRLDLWQDLCQLTELPRERERCLEHIVALDPDNARVRVELEQLRLSTAPLPLATEIDDEAPSTECEVAGASVAADKPLFCAHHPNRETRLRAQESPRRPQSAVSPLLQDGKGLLPQRRGSSPCLLRESAACPRRISPRDALDRGGLGHRDDRGPEPGKPSPGGGTR